MKIAISVPDAVFEAGERLARQLGISRNRLYSDALAQYLAARGSADVTARLNRIYAAEPSGIAPALMRAQLQRISDEAW